MVDSVNKTGENYSLQVFLEECKYVIKEKKIPKYIIDDVKFSSDSNEENSNEGTLLEKSQMEKNSDYEENSNEEILERLQREKNLKKILMMKIK